jgi:hypothetical protein
MKNALTFWKGVASGLCPDKLAVKPGLSGHRPDATDRYIPFGRPLAPAPNPFCPNLCVSVPRWQKFMFICGRDASLRVKALAVQGLPRSTLAIQRYPNLFKGFCEKYFFIFYEDLLRPNPTYWDLFRPPPLPHPSSGYGACERAAGKLTPSRQINLLANQMLANAGQKIYAPFVYP